MFGRTQVVEKRRRIRGGVVQADEEEWRDNRKYSTINPENEINLDHQT